MIGYRYISGSDWAQFQKDGYITPRPITDWVILQMLELKSLKGIWIWKKRLKGSAHVGIIIHQAIQKSSMKVYLLEITYKERWLLRPTKHGSLELTHHGKLGKWKNWTRNAKMGIIKKRIYKKDVRLIEEIDLIEKLWVQRNENKNN